MKPIIGITVECHHDLENRRSQGKLELNWNYAAAVTAAGGVPILIPPTADPESIAHLIDGLLVPGGLDIDAKRFGQVNHANVKLQDPARYDSELGIWQNAPSDLPFFGICYGCQFLNVAQGGTLHQHVPEITGTEEHSGGTLQDYQISPDSRLGQVVQVPVMQGQSWHHQSVDALAEGLRVSARHADGTVEALESTGDRWAIGVQWHPERTFDDAATQRLFMAFIAAAKAFREAR